MPCSDSGISHAFEETFKNSNEKMKKFTDNINIQAKIDYLTSLLCAQCKYIVSDEFDENFNGLAKHGAKLLPEVKTWFVNHKKCEEK